MPADTPAAPDAIPGRVAVLTTGAALDHVGGAGAARAGLAPYELARLAALRRPADRDDYLAAHALVRVLAHALLPAPLSAGGRVHLTQQCPTCGRSGHGRPALAGLTGLHVSLAHAGGWVAAAVTTVPCGIDVEPLRAADPVRSALSPAETAALDATDPDGRSELFLRLWTRKEALVKVGAATLDDLAALDVLGAPPSGLRLLDVSPPRGAVAALALGR